MILDGIWKLLSISSSSSIVIMFSSSSSSSSCCCCCTIISSIMISIMIRSSGANTTSLQMGPAPGRLELSKGSSD